MTMVECLLKKKKVELEDLMMRYGLPMQKKATKAELAEQIVQGLQEDRCRLLLCVHRSYLEALAGDLAQPDAAFQDPEGETHQDALDLLKELGLAWQDAQGWHFVQEAAELLRVSRDDQAFLLGNDVIEQMIEGQLKHVGMMPFMLLVERIADALDPIEGAEEEARGNVMMVYIARFEMHTLRILDENTAWAVHGDVDDPEKLLLRLQEPQIAELTYPVLTADQLMETGGETGLPGPKEIYLPLVRWMHKCGMADEAITEALDDMVYELQNGDRSEAAHVVLEAARPNEKDARRVTEILQELFNAIPLWDNKGHSASELGTRMILQQSKAKLPGRNDPCPCGSGKKYKQCCGKRLN